MISRAQPRPVLSYFRLECIVHDHSLVRFYTGFGSYELLLAFFEFLGPFVDHLNYWGSKQRRGEKRRHMKLDPINQLVKLRLNIKERDLAQRFGVSTSTVSRYFITWVTFLYSHLREIDWMPDPQQVKITLPYIFRERYPTTYLIIDAAKFFLKHLVICSSSLVLGQITSTTILPSSS